MFSLFFFNDTATTEIYTLSLHDALPICLVSFAADAYLNEMGITSPLQPNEKTSNGQSVTGYRSEEHTSELQSRSDLVCRLLLEKKKITFEVSTTLAAELLPTYAISFTHT